MFITQLHQKLLIFLTIIILIVMSGCRSTRIEGKRESIFENELESDIKVSRNLPKIIIPKRDTITQWRGYQVAGEDKIVQNYMVNENNKKSASFAIGMGGSLSRLYISNFVVRGNYLITIDVSGTVSAFKITENGNVDSVKILWKNSTVSSNDYKSNGYLALYNDKVIVTNGSGTVYVMDIRNGKLVWKKNVKDLIVSVPVAYKDRVYLITSENKMFVLSMKNGEIKSLHASVPSISRLEKSAHVIINPKLKEVYIPYSTGDIYAKKINSQQNQEWKIALRAKFFDVKDYIFEDITAGGIIENNSLYIGAYMGPLVKINLKTRQIEWTLEISVTQEMNSVGNYLFVIDRNSILYAVHKKTGKVKWKKNMFDLRKDTIDVAQLEKEHQSKEEVQKILKRKQNRIKKDVEDVTMISSIMANDKIVLFDDAGVVYHIEPNTGKVIKFEKIKASQLSTRPVIVGKRMYIMDRQGIMHIFR